jgi:hypothetical protein
MSQSFLDKLMYNGCIFNGHPAEGINIKITDKSSIPAVGCVQLDLQIHGISYTTNFIIMETLLFEVIVGYKFIKLNNLVIKTYQDYNILFTATSFQDIDLYATRSITIPAFSQKYVDLSWLASPKLGIYTIERDDKMIYRYGLLVARVLLKFLQVIQINSHPLYLSPIYPVSPSEYRKVKY